MATSTVTGPDHLQGYRAPTVQIAGQGAPVDGQFEAYYTHLTHLVIVCCHAIWGGGFQQPSNISDEQEWYLEDYQYGEISTFVEHIQMGLEILRDDSETLLCFSGGATKPTRTWMTEGNSYVRAANHLLDINTTHDYPDHNIRWRITAENYATDSYQNLLFSIIWFKTVTGDYPMRITLISHNFKKQRFLEYHRRAIHWSRPFLFLGKDPNPQVTSPQVLHEAESRCQADWESDLYAVSGVLCEKRFARGWRYNVSVDTMAVTGYDLTNVSSLLNYNGGSDPGTIFPGYVPWASTTNGFTMKPPRKPRKMMNVVTPGPVTEMAHEVSNEAARWTADQATTETANDS